MGSGKVGQRGKVGHRNSSAALFKKWSKSHLLLLLSTGALSSPLSDSEYKCSVGQKRRGTREGLGS